MSQDDLSRFIGGSPGRVILRLVVLSFIAGIVMSSMDLSPYDIFTMITNFFSRIWNMGFDAIEKIIGYFIMGAVIVVPLWFLSRLAGSKRGE